MPGIKRKEAPAAKAAPKSPGKKAKVEIKKKSAKLIPRDLEAEAEEDSDPIVESETPEYSGEDDGASWPSDDENGGVRIAPEASQEKPKKTEQLPTRTNDANGAPNANCMLSCG